MGDLERFLRRRVDARAENPNRRQAAMQKLRQHVQNQLTAAVDLKSLPPATARELIATRALELVQTYANNDYAHLVLTVAEQNYLVQRILAAMFGLGPIEELVHDPSITEVMVNGPGAIFVERHTAEHRSQIVRAQDSFGMPLTFADNNELLATIERIVSPINRKVDESNPIVDARLPSGARVNIVLSPVSLDGHAVTIRTFPDPISMAKLVEIGSLPLWLAGLLEQMVRAKYNLIISGGAGSGKTTFLNALSQFIPVDERIVTVEDAAELQLQQLENVVRLEARPANLEGKGAIPIRELVRSSLRMRPDRIIVGEVRGGEALDMLQAMNTGHDGSFATGHANSAQDMLTRLETMVLMSGLDLPLAAVRRQIVAAVDFIVHLSRLPDRSRKVVQFTEVVDAAADGIATRDLAVRPPGAELQPTDQRAVRMHKFRLAGIKPNHPIFSRE